MVACKQNGYKIPEVVGNDDTASGYKDGNLNTDCSRLRSGKFNFLVDGRWVAKLVARLLATPALGFEPRHLSKIKIGRHKQSTVKNGKFKKILTCHRKQKKLIICSFEMC